MSSHSKTEIASGIHRAGSGSLNGNPRTLHVVTEEMATSCAKGSKTYGLAANSLLKVYGDSNQLLVSMPLGRSYASSDHNSKGRKVATCDYSSEIWVPFNQTRYSFGFSVSSIAKSTVSQTLIRAIQAKGDTLHLESRRVCRRLNRFQHGQTF